VANLEHNTISFLIGITDMYREEKPILVFLHPLEGTRVEVVPREIEVVRNIFIRVFVSIRPRPRSIWIFSIFLSANEAREGVGLVTLVLCISNTYFFGFCRHDEPFAFPCFRFLAIVSGCGVLLNEFLIEFVFCSMNYSLLLYPSFISHNYAS
jgi:hypothetical protein